MGYVERHLLPEERVLYKTRVHWVLFTKPVFVMFVGIALAILLARVSDPPWLWWFGVAVIAAGALWAIAHYVALMTSEFAVTTLRVILKVGLLARYTTELLLVKVESIGVTQGLAGRLLNYGDLTVIGTGGTREVFHRVRDPIGFRNHVQQATAAVSGPGIRPR